MNLKLLKTFFKKIFKESIGLVEMFVHNSL